MGGIGLDISWLESVIYGLVAGLAEVLPISSIAHQSLLLSFFGITDSFAYLRLSVTAGAFVAFLFAMWPLFVRIRREEQISNSHRRRKRKSKAANMQYVFDGNLIKTACIPLLLGGILYAKIVSWVEMVPVVTLLLALNGLLLHLPGYFAKANKDSRTLSRLDGLLLGLCSALGYLPGISRMGAGLSVSSIRGADGHQALKWGMMLSVPALAVMMCVDGYGVLSGNAGTPDGTFLLKCFLVFVFAFVGTGIGIRTMKKILLRTSPESFAFYCWGAALFSFILYLY